MKIKPCINNTLKNIYKNERNKNYINKCFNRIKYIILINDQNFNQMEIKWLE